MLKPTYLMVRILSAFLPIFFLTGCAAMLLGGVAVGVSMVHDRRATTTVLDDERIELSATTAIRNDATLSKNAHTTCVSYNGTVLVTGQVYHATDQQRLTEVVNKVSGVRRVVNETTVGPPASFVELSEDVYITSRIKLALATLDLPNFDPTLVKVVTEQRHVYLMGLFTEQEAEVIANEVRYVPRVVKIIKVFEIVDSAKASDRPGHDK